VAAVLLDLDGTLTDSKDGIVRSIASALLALGVENPGEEALARCIGPPLLASFAELLGPRRRGEAGRALELYRERFLRIGIFENRVYPGIPGALTALKEDGHRLFVCTAKPAAFAERIVRHFGIDACFEGVYGPELDGTRSDKAELVLHLLRDAGLAPHETVMVGDRSHDVAAAHAHGLCALGVLWGYGGEGELRLAGADALVGSPEELPAAVRGARGPAPAPRGGGANPPRG